MILLLSAYCRYLSWNSYYGHGWCFGPSKENDGFYMCSHGESTRTVCVLYCTLCTVQSVLYTLYCTLCTVHSALYTLYCTLYTLYFTLCTVHSVSAGQKGMSEVCEPWQEKWNSTVQVSCSEGIVDLQGVLPSLSTFYSSHAILKLIHLFIKLI